MLGGGGVDGAIHRAAGPELLEECKALNGCETGEAKSTKGYRLPARYVLHTVGPIWQDGNHGEPKLLENCYRNSIRLALENELKSIAFPAISTGIYHFPKEQAAEIAVHTIAEELQKSGSSMVVWLVAFDRETGERYEKLIEQLEPSEVDFQRADAMIQLCDKWIPQFADEMIEYVTLVDHYFADDCNDLGFDMDCGQAFQAKYKNAAYDWGTLDRIIDDVKDADLLGSAIYSRWRYYNHWAYDAAEILSPSGRGWFITALNGLKRIAIESKDDSVE